MKKFILVLVLGVILFLTPCNFNNASEESFTNIHTNISTSSEEPIITDNEETQATQHQSPKKNISYIKQEQVRNIIPQDADI